MINLTNYGFAFPADYRIKLKENEERDNYRDLARKTEKTMENKSEGGTNWCDW